MSLKEGLISFITFLWSWGTSNSQDTAQQMLSFNTIVEGTILTKILEVTCPIGFILMALYFMIGLLKDGTNEKDTDIHMIVRNGIMLIISDLLLINSPKIISELMSLSNSFMKMMQDATDSASLELLDTMVSSEESILNTLPTASFFALLIMLIVSFLAFIVSLVAMMITFIVCASAKIELLLRFAYAPIGLASVAEGGAHSHEAIRYLKKLFASAFQFGAIILSIYIANILGKGVFVSPNINGDWVSFLITYLVNAAYSCVIPLAAVGAISAAKQLINEAFGV